MLLLLLLLNEMRDRPDWMKERMRRWYTEWMLDRRRQAGSDEEDEETVALSGNLKDVDVADFEKQKPEIGEMLLLSPEWNNAGMPIYVTVYSEWRPAGVLIAPFGRFSEPAVTTELKMTGDYGGGLDVLCLWNTLSVDPEKLKGHYWSVGELSAEDINNARAVYRSRVLGFEENGEWEKHIGATVTLDQDPRRQYLEEEHDAFRCLSELQR